MRCLMRTKWMDFSFDCAPEIQRQRGADNSIYTIFDCGEDNDDHSTQEYHDFKGRDLPELVHCVRRSDEIADSVDDDGGEAYQRDCQQMPSDCMLVILTGGRYIEEDRWEGVNSKKYNASRDKASQGRANASLGIDGLLNSV